MARPAGLEPATTGLEGRCSIRLSYGRPGRNGRGRGIRTPDILLPKQARYQTALYPAGRNTSVARQRNERPGIVGSARGPVNARRSGMRGARVPPPCMLPGTLPRAATRISMRSGNPALSESTFLDLGTGTVVSRDAGAMTLNGTVNKTAFLLVLTLAAAMYTWSRFFTGGIEGLMPFVWGGMIGGLVVALVTVFKKEWSPF